MVVQSQRAGSHIGRRTLVTPITRSAGETIERYAGVGGGGDRTVPRFSDFSVVPGPSALESLLGCSLKMWILVGENLGTLVKGEGH